MDLVSGSGRLLRVVVLANVMSSAAFIHRTPTSTLPIGSPAVRDPSESLPRPRRQRAVLAMGAASPEGPEHSPLESSEHELKERLRVRKSYRLNQDYENAIAKGASQQARGNHMAGMIPSMASGWHRRTRRSAAPRGAPW